LAAVVLKLVPEIVTAVPTTPLVGLKLVMVGEEEVLAVVTVKLEEEAAVASPTVMETVPVVAPVGTFTVNVVAVAAETVATTPLNLTILLASVVLKLVPVIVTVVPTTPLTGEKSVIVSDGKTV
jgi:hypothetical protein